MVGMMIPGSGPGSPALSSGSILFIPVELDLRSEVCTEARGKKETRAGARQSS